MRFIDASVFLYAYLKPKKPLPEKIRIFKKRATEIIEKISENEKVATTLVHLSEIANIIESKVNVIESSKIILAIIRNPNIKIIEVTNLDYKKAAELAQKLHVGVNDSLAYIIMRKKGIKEIYSFDKDFDKFKDIKRIY